MFNSKERQQSHDVPTDRMTVPQSLIDSYSARGRQAVIFTTDYRNINFSLLSKIYCINSDNVRPRTQEWIENGGKAGAEQLAHQMKDYRGKLQSIGFPIPEGEFFHIANRAEDGLYYPLHTSLEQGPIDAENELKNAQNSDVRRQIIDEILECSYPLAISNGIGADIKPANWVRVTRDDSTYKGSLVHVDPLPLLLYDEKDKKVVTEWPRISDPNLQAFLYETHLTPRAIGYRFYQELCQVDTMHRTEYQQIISSKLQGWVENNRLPELRIGEIIDCMNPITSRTLSDFLEGKISFERARSFIERQLEGRNHAHFPPIYELREMSFLLAERRRSQLNEENRNSTLVSEVRALTSLRTPARIRQQNLKKAFNIVLNESYKLAS